MNRLLQEQAIIALKRAQEAVGPERTRLIEEALRLHKLSLGQEEGPQINGSPIRLARGGGAPPD